MVALVSVVITGGSLGQDSSSLLKVCYLSFQFSRHGNACAAVTAIVETLPLHRQKAAIHTDMVLSDTENNFV